MRARSTAFQCLVTTDRRHILTKYSTGSIVQEYESNNAKLHVDFGNVVECWNFEIVRSSFSAFLTIDSGYTIVDPFVHYDYRFVEYGIVRCIDLVAYRGTKVCSSRRCVECRKLMPTKISNVIPDNNGPS
jgi:hypothetical protein